MKAKTGKLGNMPKFNLNILFQLPSAPQLLLKLSRKGIEVCEVDVCIADVIVKSNVSTLVVLKQKKHRMYNLLKMLLTRKLKIQGGFIDLCKFYRSLWILEEVFS